jgi:8-oxo-dGTP pyrophosphatase MutT (NUDIX family)
LYNEKLIKDMIYPFLHRKVIFPIRSKRFKFAAVMIPIHFTNGNPNVILIKRTKLVKNHAGEISFPGGIFMDKDLEMLVTALREISEEIGIKLKREQIIGYLDTERTLTSSYIIYPYVALMDSLPKIINTNYEVEKILDAPLIPLLKSRESDLNRQRQYSDPHLPKFTYKNEVIWGATARILDQLANFFSSEITN